jgi:tripeptidyl-peptidase-1
VKYTEEIVCAWNTGQAITSGGGFSFYYSRPAYQDAAVAKYFAAVALSPKIPVAGYNNLGRGFPDVSFEGHMYKVQHRTERSTHWSGTSGTSASAPVAAGMFSNINAGRLAAGKGSVGWIHPVLYKHSSLFVNDITKGNNLDGPLCPQGFYATPGWDPTTGLGSINYGKFEHFMLSLGNANSVSTYPTVEPSGKQTKHLLYHN